MADKKISALPAASLPLTETEVLPIVQAGTTDQVSVTNLTASRAISATQLTLSTDNLIIGTAGKGIDFSANANAPGMTSELLNDYEEGTFTATLAGFTTSPTVPVTSTSRYTKVGRTVTAQIAFKNVSTVGASGPIFIQGLPYAAGADAIATAAQSGMGGVNTTAGLLSSGATTIELVGAAAYVNISFTAGVGQYLFLNITYTV